MVLCLMVNCDKKTGKKNKAGQGIKFYRVLAVITDEEELIQKLTAERRRKWISAISREDLTERNCLMIGSAVFILFLEGLPKIGIDTIRTEYLH